MEFNHIILGNLEEILTCQTGERGEKKINSQLIYLA